MRMQRLRLLGRALLMLLLTLHLGTWCILGIRGVGSIRIKALFSGLSRGFLNAGFLF